MKVYLDDERNAPEGWHRVYTAAEAIAMLETGQVEEISLDHDLAFEHYAGQLDCRTGYAVVAWLEARVREDRAFKLPKVTVHSQNPSGRERMLRGLASIQHFIAERNS